MPNVTMTVNDIYTQVNSGAIRTNIDLQREIVYTPEKQSLVIDSIVKGIPLPAFYFWDNNGTLEVLDGKQRIEAITQFRHNNIEYQGRIYMETSPEVQEKINSTELTCIICSGDESMKREIFRRINTLGVPLSDYEVLNGLYHDEYLEGLTDYVTYDKEAAKVLGEASRGKRQMTALRLILQLVNEKPSFPNISQYVEDRQASSFASDQHKLDSYIDFIAAIFTEKLPLDITFKLSRKHLKDKSLWARKKSEINRAIKRYKKSDGWKLRSSASERLEDCEAVILAEVGGITLDPRRTFSAEQRQTLISQHEMRDGKIQCDNCGRWFFPDELETDHVIAWTKGGPTELSNAQLLCRICNTDKSSS